MIKFDQLQVIVVARMGWGAKINRCAVYIIQQTALVPIIGHHRVSFGTTLYEYLQHGLDASLTTLLLAIQKLKREPNFKLQQHVCVHERITSKQQTKNKANFETYCTLIYVDIATTM